MRRNNVQTFSVENSHAVYQGESLAIDKTGIAYKIIVLHTTDFVYVVMRYKLILLSLLDIFRYLWKIRCLSNALNLF